MTRTAWTSLPLAALLACGSAAAQEAAEDGVFLLEELSIQGQVREPSVEIISSRLLPEISGFRLEKSFLDQARRPDEELVDVDGRLALTTRLEDPDAMLSRPRTPRPGVKTPPPPADETTAPADADGADDE